MQKEIAIPLLCLSAVITAGARKLTIQKYSTPVPYTLNEPLIFPDFRIELIDRTTSTMTVGGAERQRVRDRFRVSLDPDAKPKDTAGEFTFETSYGFPGGLPPPHVFAAKRRVLVGVNCVEGTIKAQLVTEGPNRRLAEYGQALHPDRTLAYPHFDLILQNTAAVTRKLSPAEAEKNYQNILGTYQKAGAQLSETMKEHLRASSVWSVTVHATWSVDAGQGLQTITCEQSCEFSVSGVRFLLTQKAFTAVADGQKNLPPEARIEIKQI